LPWAAEAKPACIVISLLSSATVDPVAAESVPLAQTRTVDACAHVLSPEGDPEKLKSDAASEFDPFNAAAGTSAGAPVGGGTPEMETDDT
jgi:hypothetical protein